ncbi:MAG TPA: DPP IV N-terminal domain-containing protein [Rhizomicrobium sp.]
MARDLRVLAAALMTIGFVSGATAAPSASCFEDVAATRSYSLGIPVKPVPTPDGKAALYLRSGPRDLVQRLYEYTLASRHERELAAPETLLGGKPEQLSAQEKARRERQRVSVKGFTDFELSRDGRRVLVSLADRLYVVARPGGAITALPGTGFLAPRLSPDGTRVAAVRNHDLHVLDVATRSDHAVTHGGSDTLLHGEAEFVAQEEMDRRDGFWWSPDSRWLAYEEADLSPVEIHYVADPLHPQTPPVAFRYPRAGTANAKVRLGIIAAGGGPTVWARWDAQRFPYLARVAWQKGGPLAILVENRAQTEERLLTVDTRTGATHLLWTERDSDWLELPQPKPKDLPYWLSDGSGFLWASERSGDWQLERHSASGALKNAITPKGFRFDALLDIDTAGGSVVVQGSPDRLSRGIYRVPLRGGAPMPIAAERGLNTGEFGHQHAAFAHTYNLADGSQGADLRRGDGRLLATLPSKSEPPPALPRVATTTVGALGFDAEIIRPRNFHAGAKYPVILSVYGGPAGKLVWAAPRLAFPDQCLADEGFVVATLDNRGTPGRGRAWFRAVKDNAIDIPLADQVAGLKALGAKYEEMDLSRVGVTGWSFGGYFTVMAVLRRPDVFAAGVAGAPVFDWQDYDTFYTERYLGLPQANEAGYRASNVLTYAGQLARPLLIVHGVTDDNVYFEHTMKLTLALLKAGKPYDLLLLPGTHMLADPKLRATESARVANFFRRNLGGQPDAESSGRTGERQGTKP